MAEENKKYTPAFEVDGQALVTKLHLAAAQQVYDKCFVINTAIENDVENPDPTNPGNVKFNTKSGVYQLGFVVTDRTGLPADYEYAGGIPECLEEKDDKKLDAMDLFLSTWTRLSGEWEKLFGEQSGNSNTSSDNNTSAETSSDNQTSANESIYEMPSFVSFLKEADDPNSSITDEPEENNNEQNNSSNEENGDQEQENSEKLENPFTKLIEERQKKLKGFRDEFIKMVNDAKDKVIKNAIPLYCQTFMGAKTNEVNEKIFPVKPMYLSDKFQNASNSKDVINGTSIVFRDPSEDRKTKDELLKAVNSMKKIDPKNPKAVPKNINKRIKTKPMVWVIAYNSEMKEDS